MRFTAISRSQSSGVSCASGGRTLTPALLTRMSGSPNGSQERVAASASAARSARSALIQAASTPTARRSSVDARSVVSSRASSTTRAPARPRARAMARPMPELPPVTRATRSPSPNCSTSQEVTGTSCDNGKIGKRFPMLGCASCHRTSPRAARHNPRPRASHGPVRADPATAGGRASPTPPMPPPLGRRARRGRAAVRRGDLAHRRPRSRHPRRWPAVTRPAGRAPARCSPRSRSTGPSTPGPGSWSSPGLQRRRGRALPRAGRTGVPRRGHRDRDHGALDAGAAYREVLPGRAARRRRR